MFTATELQIKAAYALWLLDNDCPVMARSVIADIAADRPERPAVPPMKREVPK